MKNGHSRRAALAPLLPPGEPTSPAWRQTNNLTVQILAIIVYIFFSSTGVALASHWPVAFLLTVNVPSFVGFFSADGRSVAL